MPAKHLWKDVCFLQILQVCGEFTRETPGKLKLEWGTTDVTAVFKRFFKGNGTRPQISKDSPKVVEVLDFKVLVILGTTFQRF